MITCVRGIVREYLVKNGFGGLGGNFGHCACTLDELMPCVKAAGEVIPECMPMHGACDSPTPPSSFTAHGPGSDHWIALSEAGKPKSIKGCGCRLNGECAIKGDWAPGESASCDECRYQTTDQTDPQPNKPS